MRFIFMLLAAILENFVVAAPTKKRAKKFKLFGISGSGPEFGNMNFPGTKGKGHVWPTFSTMDTFINAGLNIFRISIMMERVIPNKLTNSLDSASLKGLDDMVKYITNKKAYAMIVSHNYGLYYDKVITDVSGMQAFCETLATPYKDNACAIFDTNNEFHEMDQSLVVQLNQASINSIRAAGAIKQSFTWKAMTGTALGPRPPIRKPPPWAP